MATATVSDGVSGFDILRILSPGARKKLHREGNKRKTFFIRVDRCQSYFSVDETIFEV